ncbi:hypothetical protein LEP1GSC196_1360 [Leptospira meyeri serovar Semaranga str. Veldrot Semarang 173]|nr:hypothetical protein LEP1GSC196_1360 [Leptospira meyeri serovar Semaranga str. Veldrot Semarang 173]
MTTARTKVFKIGFIISIFFMFTNCLISYKDHPKILPLPAEEKSNDAIMPCQPFLK